MAKSAAATWLEPPIIPHDLPPESRSVQWATTRINDIVSERIRRDPRVVVLDA